MRQRRQPTVALRGHLAEFGPMAPKGPASLKALEHALGPPLDGPEVDLPGPVGEMGAPYPERTARLAEVIDRPAAELDEASRTDAELRRLCTAPGIGPVTAGAVAAFAPDPGTFESGRDFAVPRGTRRTQRSTGGKARLGAVEPDGPDRHPAAADRRVTSVTRRVVRRGGGPNRWPARLVARGPKTVAAVAERPGWPARSGP